MCGYVRVMCVRVMCVWLCVVRVGLSSILHVATCERHDKIPAEKTIRPDMNVFFGPRRA